MDFNDAYDLARRQRRVMIGGVPMTLMEPAIYHVGAVGRVYANLNDFQKKHIKARRYFHLLADPDVMNTLLELLDDLLIEHPGVSFLGRKMENMAAVVKVCLSMFSEGFSGASDGSRSDVSEHEDEDVRVRIAQAAKGYGMHPDAFVRVTSWRQMKWIMPAAFQHLADVAKLIGSAFGKDTGSGQAGRGRGSGGLPASSMSSSRANQLFKGGKNGN